MAKSVFVSFEWDNDRRYKFLLEAWHHNDRFRFAFDDKTSREIDTYNIGRIKAGLTTKINQAEYTLVIVGEDANAWHKDYKLIGCRNWINFEIKQSKANRNRLVAVKLDRSYESPDELVGAGAEWAMSYSEDAILKALYQA